MWGRPKPPKYIGTDRQARVATWIALALLAAAVFFVLTLVAAVF